MSTGVVAGQTTTPVSAPGPPSRSAIPGTALGQPVTLPLPDTAALPDSWVIRKK